MTVAFTPREWADRLDRPTKDRRYQSTRTGAVVAFEYLPWKKLSAAARTLDQLERDLARGCMAFPELAEDEWTASDIITVLNLFPEGSRHRAIAHWRGFLGWVADWKDVPELHRQLRLLPKLPSKPIPIYDLFEQPKTYGVKVRDLWVAVDFEAGAVAITRENLTGPLTTEDLGDGVLIDRNSQGRIIAVEVLGDQTKGVRP